MFSDGAGLAHPASPSRTFEPIRPPRLSASFGPTSLRATVEPLGAYENAVKDIAEHLRTKCANHTDVGEFTSPAGEVAITWGFECEALLDAARIKAMRICAPVRRVERLVVSANTAVPAASKSAVALLAILVTALVGWLVKQFG